MASATGYKTVCGHAVQCLGLYESQTATAKDGTTFTPAILYPVAGRNIGIIRTTPDGNAVAFGNTLFAHPGIAGLKAQKMAREWDRDAQ